MSVLVISKTTPLVTSMGNESASMPDVPTFFEGQSFNLFAKISNPAKGAKSKPATTASSTFCIVAAEPSQRKTSRIKEINCCSTGKKEAEQ